MIYNISVTAEAKRDLQQIKKYISENLNNENSASKIVGNIIRSIRSLKEFPEIGAPLSARVTLKNDYRYLVCGNYNVFYLFENQTVTVVRILNARRDFTRLL